MSTNKQKLNWLTGLLTGWGIKESWAKLIAGAVLGALAALGVLSQSSCTASYTQSAAGDIAATVTVVKPVEVEK